MPDSPFRKALSAPGLLGTVRHCFDAIKPSGKIQHFSWVTDTLISVENLMALMRAARARWKIENEIFNTLSPRGPSRRERLTLKTPGYHFEHNLGHGYQHLSTVFAHLMMLAFLMDQIQQRCCRL